MSGKTARARKYFGRSLKLATQHEAKYEHAQTMAAYGQWGMKFGWDNAEKQMSDGEQTLKEIEFFRK